MTRKRNTTHDDNPRPAKQQTTLDTLFSLHHDSTQSVQTSVSATITSAHGSTSGLTVEVAHTSADTLTATTVDAAEPDLSLTPPALPPPLPAVHQLKVFSATPDKWSQVFNELCIGSGPVSRNSTGPSIIKPLTDNDLAFDQPTPFGHCWGLWTSTKGGCKTPKLKEAGPNNDAPRIAGARLGLNGKDTKIYNYHIIAAHKAATAPVPTLTLDLLRAVSTSKQEEKPWTVMHLCGHKWCHNMEHLAVGKKTYNDEQTSCHRILQSAKNMEDVDGIRQHACYHTLKCWTVVYKGIWADN